MYKKLNNKEWEEVINIYYKENKDMSIKDYCTKNNLNKGQFFYHKRRINDNEHKALVFQAIQLDNHEEIINTAKGAKASATIYSIIETAKANNLKIERYLSYLFDNLLNMEVRKKDLLLKLMPWSNTIPEELRLKSSK